MRRICDKRLDSSDRYLKELLSLESRIKVQGSYRGIFGAHDEFSYIYGVLTQRYDA